MKEKERISARPRARAAMERITLRAPQGLQTRFSAKICSWEHFIFLFFRKNQRGAVPPNFSTKNRKVGCASIKYLAPDRGRHRSRCFSGGLPCGGLLSVSAA